MGANSIPGTWHYHPIESGLQDFRRPLTLSLSPSDGERVAFRPGEGNTCVTSAWWWCLDPNSRRSDFFSRRGVGCAKKAARRTRSELEGGSVKTIQKLKVAKRLYV